MNSIAQIRATEKTADLIAFFNENCPEGKEVKKFADRATAIKRCVDLGEKMGLPAYTEEELKTLNPEAQAAVKAAEAEAKKEAEKADQNAKGVFATLFGMSKEQKEAHENGNGNGTKIVDGKVKSDEEPEEKAPRAIGGRASNSAGVAASWANPDVMAARLTRHGVAVTISDSPDFDAEHDPREFKSTRDAFRALRLPDSKHIRFRMKLKAEGKQTFEQGKKFYHFLLREITKPEVVGENGETVEEAKSEQPSGKVKGAKK